MARALALDVGNRRIGVALSDVSKLLARPLTVIDRQTDAATARIAGLITQHGVDEIVVGLPYHADGKLSVQAGLVRAFADSLTAVTGVRMTYVDERWSTQDAKAIIANLKKKKQPAHDDAIAAAVILQRYLDEMHERLDNDGLDD